MIFHPICKCDRRTIISKIGSAELQVVSNDGIKSPFKGFLKPLLAFFDLTERMKPVKTNGSKKTILTVIVRLAYTRRLITEQKMQSRCKFFRRGGAEKKEIMPVRRKNGFYKGTRFGHENSQWDTGLDEKKPCR